MNFEVLTQPNRYQAKNLLIQGVKIKLVGYDNNYNINDDIVQVTLISRTSLYDKNRGIIKKKSGYDSLLYNTNSKRVVEIVHSILSKTQNQEINEEIVKFDKFKVDPVSKYHEIKDIHVDFIRMNIVDPFTQNMTYKQDNDLRFRWIISSTPLVSCIANRRSSEEGTELELEFKSMKIPDSIKNQADEKHEFYLVFTLLRSMPMDYPMVIDLKSGFDPSNDHPELNTLTKRNIGFVMSTIATTCSNPFVFTNKR